MKELWLVRHAKSSWSDYSLRDHDRPLNKRGKRDAPKMALHLMGKHTIPELFLTSTALRASNTAKAFCKEMNIDVALLDSSKELYHSLPMEILNEVHRINENYASAAVFCHNPGITDLVNQLVHETFDNIPTCGVAIIRSEAEFWSTFEAGETSLKAYYYPKMFVDED